MDERELEASVGHLRYEVEMLCATGGYLAAAPSEVPRFQHYAHLESFLMHVRNLWDFLTNKGGGRPDDILAKLYNDKSSWRPARVPSELGAINKHVAHITTKRLTETSWDVSALAVTTLDGFAEFVESVAPQRRDWFDWFER